jgi:PAS domain-containing protein
MLTGLFISMYSIFESEARSASDLLQANQSLAAQIAEREQIEERLRRAHDEMEERVRARTADLRAANQSLEAEIGVRARAEAALRESSDLVRLLLDSIPEGVYGIDMQGKCTFCSPLLSPLIRLSTV